MTAPLKTKTVIDSERLYFDYMTNSIEYLPTREQRVIRDERGNIICFKVNYDCSIDGDDITVIRHYTAKGIYHESGETFPGMVQTLKEQALDNLIISILYNSLSEYQATRPVVVAFVEWASAILIKNGRQAELDYALNVSLPRLQAAHIDSCNDILEYVGKVYSEREKRGEIKHHGMHGAYTGE